MKKFIISPENPQGIYVDLTAEEITQNEQDAIQAQADETARQQAREQKKADALAGNNKLLELGLTQAEVTAMTGYTPPVSE